MQTCGGVAAEVECLRLLGARVLVDPEPVDRMMAGGLLHKPDNAVIRYGQRGKVVAIGPKVQAVKVDEIVLHGRWAHVAVELDGREYLVFNESDLMGVLPDAASLCR